MPGPIIHNFFEKCSWKMIDCHVFNKKSVKLNFWNLIKIGEILNFFEVFLKNSIFLDISPKILWMDFVSIQKVRKNKTSLIKRPLKTRNSSFWVKCPFFHVKGPLFSLLKDFFHWLIIFSEKKYTFCMKKWPFQL